MLLFCSLLIRIQLYYHLTVYTKMARKQRFNNRCLDCHTRDVPARYTRCRQCRARPPNQAGTQPQTTAVGMM